MQSESSRATSTERPNEIWSIATPMRGSTSEQNMVRNKNQSLQDSQLMKNDRPCLEWMHNYKFNIMDEATSWESLSSRDYIG